MGNRRKSELTIVTDTEPVERPQDLDDDDLLAWVRDADRRVRARARRLLEQTGD